MAGRGTHPEETQEDVLEKVTSQRRLEERGGVYQANEREAGYSKLRGQVASSWGRRSLVAPSSESCCQPGFPTLSHGFP